MSDTATLSELLAELQRLHQARYTGLLFVSSDNRIAQLNLEQGEIVFLSCQNKRGEEALPLLRAMCDSKLRFTAGPIPTFRTPLPSTDQVLAYLQGGQSAPPKAPLPTASLTAKQRQVLQEELTEFIGPMALFVCEEQLNGVADLETALTVLSQVLTGVGQAARFQASVRKRL